MPKFKTTKTGEKIYTTARGFRYCYKTTKPGDPLNNHAPRVGTKRPAGSRHQCRCEICVGHKSATVNKILEREFMKAVKKAMSE